MNETTTSLDKSLAALIDGASEKGTKLIDWLYEQAPDLIEQLLLWHGVQSVIECAIGVIFIFGLPYIAYKLSKKHWNWCVSKRYSFDDPECWAPLIMGNITALCVSQAVGWGFINLTWLKIWIAPKVWLLDYLTNFAK